jgi:site-specific DNA recombinase
LAGLIVDADGNRMTPSHATKKAKRYRYYVSASLLAGDRPQSQKGMRVPAGDIEALVLNRLRAFFSSRTDVGDALAPLDLEAHALDAALSNASKLSERWLAMPRIELTSLVRKVVERVTVAADRIEIRLCRTKVAAALEAGGQNQRPDLDPVVISIEAKLQRSGQGEAPSHREWRRSRNQRRPHRLDRRSVCDSEPVSRSDDSIEAMTERLGIVRLSHLAPDIVRALLKGRQPIELTPTRLLRLSKDLPHEWIVQRHLLGFAG